MQGDPLYQFLANLFDSSPLCDGGGSSEVQVVYDTPGWFLVCFRLSVLCNPVVLEYCSVILTPQHKVNQKKKVVKTLLFYPGVPLKGLKKLLKPWLIGGFCFWPL